jgi:hypothetical protein
MAETNSAIEAETEYTEIRALLLSDSHSNSNSRCNSDSLADLEQAEAERKKRKAAMKAFMDAEIVKNQGLAASLREREAVLREKRKHMEAMEALEALEAEGAMGVDGKQEIYVSGEHAEIVAK